MRQLASRLEPGGLLHAATDHEGYAEAIAEVLAGEPLLENLHAPAAWSSEAAASLRDGVRARMACAGARVPLFCVSAQARVDRRLTPLPAALGSHTALRGIACWNAPI